MAQSKYKPKNHPVNNNMPVGNQVGYLAGKIGVNVKTIEKEPEEEVEVVLIDGNTMVDNMIWDGNGKV